MSEPIFRQGICAYCGNVGDVTDDHIVPQCLWPGRVPKDSPQITACKPCNHVWKSEYDTYLRDMLVNDMACAKNPIAQKVREKFYRAAENNRSIMARDLNEKAGLVGLQEDSGIISGFALTLPDGVKRNRVIMPLIVRGLHLYYLRTALPQDTLFEVTRIIEREKMQEILQEMNEKGGAYQNDAIPNVV